jgi:hypothetical protein
MELFFKRIEWLLMLIPEMLSSIIVIYVDILVSLFSLVLRIELPWWQELMGQWVFVAPWPTKKSSPVSAEEAFNLANDVVLQHYGVSIQDAHALLRLSRVYIHTVHTSPISTDYLFTEEWKDGQFIMRSYEYPELYSSGRSVAASMYDFNANIAPEINKRRAIDDYNWTVRHFLGSYAQ